MPVELAPYAQKIVSDHLRGHADVVAITDRIVATPPDGDQRDTPWVQVRELGSPQMDGAPFEWLTEHYFQFDCYAGEAGGFPEARRLGETVRAALHELVGVVPGAGAVVSAVRVAGSNPMPDTAMEPARDRRVVTAGVWIHPSP